jgi:hypothetical protein
MAVLRRLRADYPEYQAEELSLLTGIPGPLSAAAGTSGARGALHQRVFRRAAARQIAMAGDLGHDVVFQIEAAAETAAVASAPPFLRRSAAWLAAGGICRLAALTPPGTRMTVHLCLGGLQGKATGYPSSAEPLVALANAISMRWPPQCELELVHLPLAPANGAASIDPRVYAPLSRLALPETTRLALGIVSAAQPWQTQVLLARIAAVAAAVAGIYRPSISPPCSLLGKAEHEAMEIVTRAVRVAEELASQPPRPETDPLGTTGESLAGISMTAQPSLPAAAAAASLSARHPMPVP